MSLSDCPCVSHDEKLVKPGWVVTESECEKCQCIDNYYTCDTSSCTGVTSPEPPMLCDESDFIPLINGNPPLPNEAFDSSSILTEKFKPSNAKLNNKISDDSAGKFINKI